MDRIKVEVRELSSKFVSEREDKEDEARRNDEEDECPFRARIPTVATTLKRINIIFTALFVKLLWLLTSSSVVLRSNRVVSILAIVESPRG